MAGRLSDLEEPSVRIPDTLIVDTNLVVARVLSIDRLPRLPETPRTTRFFAMLRGPGAIGYLPPVVAQEFFHIAIQESFRDSLSRHQLVLAEALPTRCRFDWNDLDKVKPELLDLFRPQLERLQHLLSAGGMQLLQPNDLAPLPEGTRWETEIFRLIGHYGLDTSHAAILLDAQRAGITSIATLDADLRRA